MHPQSHESEIELQPRQQKFTAATDLDSSGKDVQSIEQSTKIN